MANNILTTNLSSGDVLSFSSLNTDVYINESYTSSDILRVVNSNNIPPRYKIYVLYPDDTINYEIPLEDIKSGGSYSENYQDGQRRTLNFSLYNGHKKYTPNINTFWADTRIRLDLGIEMPNGVTV